MQRFSVRRGLRWMVFFSLAAIAADALALFIVNEPWVRPAANGGATEAYMNITSTEAATLVAVNTEDAARIMLRGPGAKPAVPLRLAPKTVVALSPKTQRFVLSGLRRKIALGDHVALVLTIEDAGGTRQEIPVSAEARIRSPIDDERRHHPTHSHQH